MLWLCVRDGDGDGGGSYEASAILSGILFVVAASRAQRKINKKQKMASKMLHMIVSSDSIERLIWLIGRLARLSGSTTKGWTNTIVSNMEPHQSPLHHLFPSPHSTTMLPSTSAAAAAPSAAQHPDDFETYLLLLLSDSNLPTGGFVASSGLESFHAHGLLHNARPTADLAKYGHTSPSPARKGAGTAPSQAQLSSATLSYAQSTLHSYARSSFGFIARVHAVVQGYLDEGVRGKGEEGRLGECLGSIARLDYAYHTLLLNHVARRASKAQGIALLTLYSKAFAKPINLDREAFAGSCLHSGDPPAASEKTRIELAAALVDRLKLDIRRSATCSSPGGMATHGHLPICWAVFSACLGISLQKAVFLHLFLQARSLFSSSIRLNTLGPYLAHQIMRFQMRGVVEGIIREMQAAGCLNVDPRVAGEEKQEEEPMQVDPEPVRAYDIPEASAHPTVKGGKPFRTTATMTGTCSSALRPKVQALRIGNGQLIAVDDDDPNQGWAWDWPEDQDFGADEPAAVDSEKGFWTQPWAPATTFPLGEIVQARHDQLHSRLFNS